MLTLVLLLVATADSQAPPSFGAPSPESMEGKEAPFVIDRVIAVVNRSVVLQSEVELMLDQAISASRMPAEEAERMRPKLREEVLDTLIAERLLEEEVHKLRIDVTDAEVDRVVQGTMKEHGLDLEKLKLALQRQGLTLEEYKNGLKKQLTKMKIVQLKVKNRVNVDDQAVKAAYAQRKILEEREFRVKARHILFLVPPGASDVDAKQRAMIALQRLQNGAAFAALAKELSEDPGSREHGGSLGEFGRGEMVPEFEKAAFTAEPGKIVGPIRTQFGWHLILVEERVPLTPKPEDQALEALRKQLFEREVETQFNAYLEELKRNAHIEKRL